MDLATNNIKTLAMSNPYSCSITLDYTTKRVYWIHQDGNYFSYIFSSDYDFQDQKNIRNGSFRVHILAIFGDSLYVQNDGGFYINKINVSNGNIVRSILYNKPYNDLIVLHSSLQPMGT